MENLDREDTSIQEQDAEFDRRGRQGVEGNEDIQRLFESEDELSWYAVVRNYFGESLQRLEFILGHYRLDIGTTTSGQYSYRQISLQNCNDRLQRLNRPQNSAAIYANNATRLTTAQESSAAHEVLVYILVRRRSASETVARTVKATHDPSVVLPAELSLTMFVEMDRY